MVATNCIRVIIDKQLRQEFKTLTINAPQTSELQFCYAFSAGNFGEIKIFADEVIDYSNQ